MELHNPARVTQTRGQIPTFFVDAIPAAGATGALSPEAAHHARVRRLSRGDRIGLTDGAGAWASASLSALERHEALVAVESVETRRPPPELHLYVPVADRDRMLWLAEKAAEIGVTSWRAVRFRRSASVSPRGEGDAFRVKVRARMISAVEQSNGAWLPRLEPDLPVTALESVRGARLLLDASATSGLGGADRSRGMHVLVGPEGGLEPDELSMVTTWGWSPRVLGESVLRFETAALAAIAILQIGSPHG